MEKVFACPRVSSVTIAPDSNRIVYFPLTHTSCNNRDRNSTIWDLCSPILQLIRLCPSPEGERPRAQLTEVAKEVLTTSPNDCNFRDRSRLDLLPFSVRPADVGGHCRVCRWQCFDQVSFKGCQTPPSLDPANSRPDLHRFRRGDHVSSETGAFQVHSRDSGHHFRRSGRLLVRGRLSRFYSGQTSKCDKTGRD